jgi:hypothetical protein
MCDLELPELILLSDHQGDWTKYKEAIYKVFKADFVDSKPEFSRRAVRLKRYPLYENKEATFWHFISEGEKEEDRTPDLRRCERIAWPRPIMGGFEDEQPQGDVPVLWWRQKHPSEWRYVLALQDFSYVVVVADRGEYVLPWTAFFVEREHQRKKYERQYLEYWGPKKS